MSAMGAYNGHRYEEAEKYFFSMITANPESAEVGYALEYLRKIENESGNVKAALSQFRVMKDSGAIAVPDQWKTSHPASLVGLAKPSDFGLQLAKLFKVGGLIAARTSMISFIFDSLNMLEEANYYQDKALGILKVTQNSAEQKKVQSILARPLSYLRPGIMNALEVPAYTPAEIEVLSFPTIEQLAALELLPNNILEKWETELSFAYLPQYDSDADRESPSAPTANGPMSGYAQNFFLKAGSHGNILKPTIFGWEYDFYTRQYNADASKAYNTLTHAPAVWISWWNGSSDEFAAWWRFAFTNKTSSVTTATTTEQGPQLAWSHLWNHRYKLDLAYQLSFNHDYYDDSGKSGRDHALSLSFSYPGVAKPTRPYLKYVFDRNIAGGQEISSSSHTFTAGSAYLFTPYTVLDVGASMSWVNYVFDTQRYDHVKGLSGRFIFPLMEDKLEGTVQGEYQNWFSSLTQYSYNRYTISAGFVSNLRF